jgi:protein-S-isoprenylcysteine O-methyltransferase Ste14
MRGRIAAALFRYRGGFWALVFLAGLLLPRWSPERFFLSLPLLVGGQALRFWAAGSIPRYRTERLDAPVLVDWGPYGWVRNPLYLGNSLIGLGWGLMANPLLIPFFLVLNAALLGVLIPYEEAYLEGRFGAAYREYRSRVPALFPRPSRRSSREDAEWPVHPYDWRRALRSEVHSLWVNFAATGILLLRLLLPGGTG